MPLLVLIRCCGTMKQSAILTPCSGAWMAAATTLPIPDREPLQPPCHDSWTTLTQTASFPRYLSYHVISLAGVSLPRGGRDPSILPSARAVSVAVHHVLENRPRPAVSHMVMQFGQFLDHDMTDSPNGVPEESKGEPEGPPQCCLPDRRNRNWIFPEDGNNDQPNTCFPIPIPENDRFWGARGRR